MSFLAPLFLLGAAAIALPVIFHLIRRSTKEKVFFSSLMFLTPSPPKVTKRSRIENLLLLLVRGAVLLLIAGAFARPFFREAIPRETSTGAARRVVVLVDHSASMKRGQLWTEAQAKAASAMRSAGAEDQAALLAFDSAVQGLLGFEESARLSPQERAAQTAARLSAVAPSYGATQLDQALIEAAELIADSFNTNSSKAELRGEIVLISDLQAGSKLEALQGYEWPKYINVRLETVEQLETSNASLQALGEGAARQLLATNTLRVRVHNHLGSKREQFELAWTRDNQLASARLPVYVPPGQGRVVAAPALPAGITASELTLFGDAEVFDNTIFYVSGERKTASILYFGKDEENDPQGLHYYLKRALEDGSGGIVKVAAGIQPGIAEASMAVVARALSEPELASIRGLMEAGKSVLLTAPNMESLQGARQVTGLFNLRATEAEVRNYQLLSRIDFNHPLFATFADAKFSDFTKLNFWHYRKIDLAGATNATAIAQFDSGDPAVIEFSGQPGKVYLLAASWTPGDSQLALSSKFVPLLFTMLEQGGELLQSTPQYVAGQTITVPEGAQITGPGMQPTNVVGSSFTPDQPGVYNINGKPGFAINLDPAESRISPMGVDTLQSLAVPISAAVQSAKELAKQKEQKQQLVDTEMESRQKLWRTALVAAFALLLIETIMAKRASSQLVPV